MMMIIIKEDGSTSITAEGYSAWYDKDGRLDMSIGGKAPQHLIIHNAFEPKAEKQQVSKTYPAGMTLAVDEGIKAGVTADGFKVFNVASGVTYLGSAVIDAAKINKAHDDHLRYIIREEILLFVARESERGGLFSTW